jgi:branched-chain amino acid transport system substrate-binding protein
MTAIAKAAQTANGKPTRQQVADAMKTLGTYAGVTGNIKFNEKGDRVPATYFIQEVKTTDPSKWTSNPIVQRLELEPPKK